MFVPGFFPGPIWNPNFNLIETIQKYHIVKILKEEIS